MLIKADQLKVNTRWTKLPRQREAVMAKHQITRGEELNNNTKKLTHSTWVTPS